MPFPCESGRVLYDAGEPYALGLTLAGPDRTLAGDLIAGLERLGGSRPGGPAPVLGGNFVVERAERLDPPDLGADAAALRKASSVELRLVSPLRLERPADLKRSGAGFLDRDCFPPAVFLDRLWRRLFYLTWQRYPDDDERRRLQPPADGATAACERLLWSDLPVRGTPSKDRRYTLGGVRGPLTLAGLDEAWLEVLVAGSYLHAGSVTAYGFGRYTIAGTSSADDPLLPPGRTLLDRLAEPALDDETSQRAAGEVLAPVIDAWLEESSAAYRRGFSRQGAARGVARARADGYRDVLDGGLLPFLDRIDRQVLFDRLGALFPCEPLVDRVRAWTEAPPSGEDEPAPGLPRASPFAALLAKLCLDRIDDEVAAESLRLVRFGDDFAVLAKDPQTPHPPGPPLPPAPIPPGEGGTRHASLTARESAAAREGGGAPLPAGWERMGEGTGVRDSGRWPLYVTTPETRIYLRRGTVVLEPRPGEERRIPLAAVSHAVFIGRVRATLPVLLSLAREGVPSFFCRASGELEAVLGPQRADWPLWTQQARAASDARLRLSFASAVVAARLKNLAAMLVRFGWEGAAEAAAEMRSLARETVNKDTLDALRGLEGRGTALAWTALAASLPAAWGFGGRARRPPPDPVNGMLSFGQTLLYNHCSTALQAAGLNPRIGLFHQPHGAHDALASDLQEEVRHLVESLVWTLVQRRQLTPEDFGPSPDGRFPALLRPEGRRTFLDAFERRLMTEFTPADEEEPLSYRAFLARQARQIRDLVQGRRPFYSPLVRRA